MYKLIDNLPIDYDFNSKNKRELKLYGKWFEENKDIRLKSLINVVQDEFKDWKGNYSPESLKYLGKWLEQHIEVEKLSEEEYRVKRSSVPDYIEINDWDLSVKTRSILVDIGIYFGEVFIRNNKGLKWEQYFSRIKNDSNHGHMVIPGFGKKELNSIWILYILGEGLADNTRNGSDLYLLYEKWCSYL